MWSFIETQKSLIKQKIELIIKKISSLEQLIGYLHSELLETNKKIKKSYNYENILLLQQKQKDLLKCLSLVGNKEFIFIFHNPELIQAKIGNFITNNLNLLQSNVRILTLLENYIKQPTGNLMVYLFLIALIILFIIYYKILLKPILILKFYLLSKIFYY